MAGGVIQLLITNLCELHVPAVSSGKEFRTHSVRGYVDLGAVWTV